jgi:cephalosporin hydroxylase
MKSFFLRKLIEVIHKIKHGSAKKLSLDLLGKSSAMSAHSSKKLTMEDLWVSFVIGKDAPHYSLKWKDIEMSKFPTDIYIYQQLVWTSNYDLIIEVGTQRGSSAIFFDNLIKSNTNANGLVVTIDINPVPEPQKSTLDSLGIVMITGDINLKSTQQKIIPYIKGKNFLVVDDGSHRYKDVMASLKFFQEHQAPGNHMVVEDGITDVMLAKKTKNALDCVDDFLDENSDYLRVLDYDSWLVSTTFGGIIKKL